MSLYLSNLQPLVRRSADNLYVTGYNISDATAAAVVTLSGAIDILDIEVLSTHELRLGVGAIPVGSHFVNVYRPGAVTETAVVEWEEAEPPDLYPIAVPSSGPPGTTIYVSGINLFDTSWKFDGVPIFPTTEEESPANSEPIFSDTPGTSPIYGYASFVVPAHAPGEIDIEVRTHPAGEFARTATVPFTVTAEPAAPLDTWNVRFFQYPGGYLQLVEELDSVGAWGGGSSALKVEYINNTFDTATEVAIGQRWYALIDVHLSEPTDSGTGFTLSWDDALGNLLSSVGLVWPNGVPFGISEWMGDERPPSFGVYTFLLAGVADGPVDLTAELSIVTTGAGAGLTPGSATISVTAAPEPPGVTITATASIEVVADLPNIGTTPGPLNLSIPNTEWESPRAAHVWLTPQRANMVANPSFEALVNGATSPIQMDVLTELADDAEAADTLSIPLALDEGIDYGYGSGTYGSGTYGGAGSNVYNLYVAVFNVIDGGDLTFTLGDEWVIIQRNRWLVAVTTEAPATFDVECDGLMDDYTLDIYGLSNVLLEGPTVLETVPQIGIVGFDSQDNTLGGASITTNPLVPGDFGTHLDGRFVFQIVRRWPATGSSYVDTQTGADPWTHSPLGLVADPGNEDRVTEALSMEFLAVPPDAAFGWRTNGTLEVVNSGGNGVQGPVPIGPFPRTYAAHITTLEPGEPIVLESNLFPTTVAQDNFWSLECQVVGSGQARIGLVTWDPAALVPQYTAGPWVELANNSVFQPINALIGTPEQAYEACFRLEFIGEDLWVDNVMVDNNAAQLGYFDGDWGTGMEGDFSWYGSWGRNGAVDPNGIGSDRYRNLRNRSFSLYYNDRRNQDAWLFGYTEEVAKEGRLMDLAPYNETAPTEFSPLVDEDEDISAARDLLLATGMLGLDIGVTQLVPDPLNEGALIPEVVGTLSRIALSTLKRVGGEAWKWVPEGAEVIPQWDHVYDTKLSCWPGELFIPVKDVSATPVTIIEEG